MQDERLVSQPTPRPGPFLAKVVSHLDTSYMGTLEVEILRPVGGDGSAGALHQVKYMSPFFGATSVDFNTSNNDYNSTQKSYGIWAVPPDVGTVVVVIFIDGDPKRGYWIGCVPDDNINFMVPGVAATSYNTKDKAQRLPVAEYNKKLADNGAAPGLDTTKIAKPVHPLHAVLEAQGLIKDDIRGITTSSARREVPSAVFGWNTPGPVDKKGPKSSVGKKENKIQGAFVSRLGGSSFVMDDGDDKYIRKTTADAGPPEYVSVETDGIAGGNVKIPHNELVRIRTRTGHQILLHNSEDLIYIGNAKGTTWIELTSMGKIDIYAKDSVSVHSEADINFTADKNINFTAKENINFNAKNIYETASVNVEIKAGADGKLTANTTHIKASGNNNLTAAGETNIKSGGRHIENAAGYFSLPAGSGVSAVSGVASPATAAIVAPRVPQHEPWAEHENLHGQALKYTTKTDTFKKGGS